MMKYHTYFNKIIIALTAGLADRDESDFLRKDMPYVSFVKTPAPEAAQDWRNVAVNDLLQHSNAETVIFFEQDFLCTKEFFYSFVSKCDKEFIGLKEGDRIHPAFILTKRMYIDKTSKDFSAYPPDHDHFGKFTRELERQVAFRPIDYFGFENKDIFYHLNGLTQNYMCFREQQPYYKPYEFLTYNHYCLQLPLYFEPSFKELMQNIDTAYEPDKDVKFIRQLFPKQYEKSL